MVFGTLGEIRQIAISYIHCVNKYLLGKIPVSKDSLINADRSMEMWESRIFNNLLSMLFGPLDLPFFRDLMTDDTSS